MEKNAHYFWAGLFVVAAFAALTGFLVWLMGAQGDARDYARYTVYFTDTVTGLEEGSGVQYQGVKVGRVLKLRLDGKREELIKADIEVRKETPVHAATKAYIAMQGVTGVVHVELKGEPRDDKPPRRRDDEAYPVLEGTSSQWSRAMDDLPVITQQIREITAKINSLLNEKNMQTLTKLLGG
jgi:phospholipid/cholesterol/gamma-HCH transport system substrate-binding protein